MRTIVRELVVRGAAENVVSSCRPPGNSDPFFCFRNCEYCEELCAECRSYHCRGGVSDSKNCLTKVMAEVVSEIEAQEKELKTSCKTIKRHAKRMKDCTLKWKTTCSDVWLLGWTYSLPRVGSSIVNAFFSDSRREALVKISMESSEVRRLS